MGKVGSPKYSLASEGLLADRAGTAHAGTHVPLVMVQSSAVACAITTPATTASSSSFISAGRPGREGGEGRQVRGLMQCGSRH